MEISPPFILLGIVPTVLNKFTSSVITRTIVTVPGIQIIHPSILRGECPSTNRYGEGVSESVSKCTKNVK